MAGHNRHLRGATEDILAPVRGKTVIEAGDLVYKEDSDSYYTFPFSDFKNSGASMYQDLIDHFLGIAMEGSPSGVTENITVATAGVFRYPLNYASAVTFGAVVSAATVTVGVGVTNQVVANSCVPTHGSSAILGIIVKHESSAVSFVDFRLYTSDNRPSSVTAA